MAVVVRVVTEARRDHLGCRLDMEDPCGTTRLCDPRPEILYHLALSGSCIHFGNLMVNLKKGRTSRKRTTLIPQERDLMTKSAELHATSLCSSAEPPKSRPRERDKKEVAMNDNDGIRQRGRHVCRCSFLMQMTSDLSLPSESVLVSHGWIKDAHRTLAYHSSARSPQQRITHSYQCRAGHT